VGTSLFPYEFIEREENPGQGDNMDGISCDDEMTTRLAVPTVTRFPSACTTRCLAKYNLTSGVLSAE